MQKLLGCKTRIRRIPEIFQRDPRDFPRHWLAETLATLFARSFNNPSNIPAPWRRENAVFHLCDGNQGALLEPFLNLRMSIGEAKTAGPVMVTRRQIVPRIELSDRSDKPAIINAVRMFVHEHPELGRRGMPDIGHLIVAVPARIPK